MSLPIFNSFPTLISRFRGLKWVFSQFLCEICVVVSGNPTQKADVSESKRPCLARAFSCAQLAAENVRSRPRWEWDSKFDSLWNCFNSLPALHSVALTLHLKALTLAFLSFVFPLYQQLYFCFFLSAVSFIKMTQKKNTPRSVIPECLPLSFYRACGTDSRSEGTSEGRLSTGWSISDGVILSDRSKDWKGKMLNWFAKYTWATDGIPGQTAQVKYMCGKHWCKTFLFIDIHPLVSLARPLVSILQTEAIFAFCSILGFSCTFILFSFFCHVNLRWLSIIFFVLFL